MTNAKEEFVSHVRDNPVLCVDLQYSDDYNQNKKTFVLKENFTAEEYEAFLGALDFSYESGYGAQELFGIILYTDGTWSERAEYDGSEWWEHKVCPAIPAVCRRGK